MIERFFTFFQSYRSGIFFFLFCLAAVAFLVQWFAWIFGWGRFGKKLSETGAEAESGTGTGSTTVSGQTTIRFMFSGALVKIINDFRHLLALVVVLIFAVALLYSLWQAASIPTFATNPADPSLTIPGTPSVIDNMKEALQAVVATLGGLVGSIIGYYFGESSIAKSADKTQTAKPDSSPMRKAKVESKSEGPEAG